MVPLDVHRARLNHGTHVKVTRMVCKDGHCGACIDSLLKLKWHHRGTLNVAGCDGLCVGSRARLLRPKSWHQHTSPLLLAVHDQRLMTLLLSLIIISSWASKRQSHSIKYDDRDPVGHDSF
jgi:hypothetical protein